MKWYTAKIILANGTTHKRWFRTDFVHIANINNVIRTGLGGGEEFYLIINNTVYRGSSIVAVTIKPSNILNLFRK